MARCSCTANTISHPTTKTTTVRIAVASVDGTPSTPNFARIAVSADAPADRNAYRSHCMLTTVSRWHPGPGHAFEAIPHGAFHAEPSEDARVCRLQRVRPADAWITTAATAIRGD